MKTKLLTDAELKVIEFIHLAVDSAKPEHQNRINTMAIELLCLYMVEDNTKQ